MEETANESVVKRNVFASYLINVVFGTYFQLPIWVVYQSSFLNFKQIAFYAAFALVVEVVAQLPTGAFADIFGRRVSLALGNLFMALPMFLIALFPQPWIMLPYSITWGLGKAFSVGTDRPILYETLHEAGQSHRYQKILGDTIVAFQLSAALSILAGGYFFQISRVLPYYVSGIGSLIGVVAAFIFVEPTRKHTFSLTTFVNTNITGFKEIFKSSYMSLLTFMYMLVAGIATANQQFFIQPYMVELGMSTLQRTWGAMIIKIAIAFAGTWLVSKKFAKSRKFILFMPLIMVVSLLPAMFVKLPYAIILFVGIAFASGNKTLFFEPEIIRNIRASIRSTALSAQKLLASLVGAAVQFISGGIIAGSSVGTFYTYLGIFSLLVILPIAYAVMNHEQSTL